eukprot:2929571-Pyramimonas_sp.AAC.1
MAGVAVGHSKGQPPEDESQSSLFDHVAVGRVRSARLGRSLQRRCALPGSPTASRPWSVSGSLSVRP